jgi:hypothetical protein
MSRRTRPSIARPWKLLTPDAIESEEPELFALGWRFETRTSASRRDQDGCRTAAVYTDTQRDGDGELIELWTGAVPDAFSVFRRLRQGVQKPETAMRTIEMAEWGGPHSTHWEGQSGAPQRDGWEHSVKHMRDIWYKPAPGRNFLHVLQAPLENGSRTLRYATAIGGVYVQRDGVRRLFEHPFIAMDAVEREALRRHLPAKPEHSG